MENRIKEQFSLFSDRLSDATMRANQFRLYLSSLALYCYRLCAVWVFGYGTGGRASFYPASEIAEDLELRFGSRCAESGSRWRPAMPTDSCSKPSTNNLRC